MSDDAHPTAMLSGLLLGMLMAMTLFAGPVAWHNAIGDSCRLTSFEIGHSADIACPVAKSNIRRRGAY